jgi:predicted membrane chloride channel (bestrophin family)
LQSLNSEKDHYQQLISALQQQLKTSLAEIQQSEEKTSLLEIELTQNFVLHNSDRNHLQQELDQQTQLTSLLHTQIQELKASQSSPAATGEASDPMALF